jgi:cell division septation protein DedD
MAAHIGQPARSRRFIKAYLCTWGLLAVGALAYLAILAFPPQAVVPPQAAVTPPSVGVGESKAIAEVKGSLNDIRKDVTELQTSVGERVETEKVVKTRLTALEDRVSTIDGAPATDVGAPGKGEPSAGETPAKAQAVTPQAVKPPFVPIETGSISPKEEVREEIVFGEPVVTKGGQEFAVQLAAAPSLNALKQSWGQLSERHAGALGSLRARVVAPRGEGGIYRLVVGPLPTKADAERVCSELQIGPKACFPTPFAGSPF